MSAVPMEQHLPQLPHAGPWTEEDFLALPESQERIELFDGSLLMTPAPRGGHQQVSRRLADVFELATPKDVEVFEAVNLRVGPDRILIPDMLATRERGDALVYQPDDALLVAEIVSPSTRSQDRVLKPALYAAAGIPWYLLVELDRDGGLELSMHRRSGDTYAEQGRARPGEVLRVEEPEVDLDPNVLLDEAAFWDFALQHARRARDER